MPDNPWRALGAQGAKPQHPGSWKSTLLVWGIGLGVIFMLAGLLLPTVRSARPAALRLQCANNLRNVSIALQNYHLRNGSFPPAYTVDTDGRPLHSWRTLILPFLDQEALYDKIDLTKPWDDPVNREASQTIVELYHCTEHSGDANLTNVQVIVGSQTVFPPHNGVKSLSDITDPHGATLLLVEMDTAHAVPWMSPRDASVSDFLAINSQSRLPHGDVINAVFVDGSYRILDPALPEKSRRAILTINGNEALDGEF